MNEILKISDIMTTNLVSVSLDTNIYEIVKLMQDKKISSIVIVENNKPLGIITERDILKASLSPKENLKKSVSDLMSSPVYKIEHNLDYRDAYMQMTEHKIRHLIVVDDLGSLLGMLSESDFLRHLNPEQLLAIKEVTKVMTSNVFTCSPNDSACSVLKQMAEYGVSSIIVQENNKALGVISERDSLKLIQKSTKELEGPIGIYMSSPVFTIHKNQTVLNAQTIMEDSHIRRLVVVDDNDEIAGIITRHDLIKSIPEYYVEILREMIDRQKKLVLNTQTKLDESTIFHNAMKALPHNLVFMTNKEGIIEFINTKESEICNLLKVTTGSKIDELDNKLFDIMNNNEWKELVFNGETLHKIVKTPNKHNSFCYFHTSISAILNTQNAFEGYMYIAHDISQQQTLEKELKRLNNNLQEAYQVAKIGNWKLDAKTLSAFWSNEICDIFGMPHNSTGSTQVLKTLVNDDDFEEIESSLISALQTGRSHELIYEIFPKNGAVSCWVECRARRELDSEGNVLCLVGTLQDVSNRVESEKHIEHLNSLLKSIRNINQLIVKEKNIPRLMQSVCNEVMSIKKINGMWILIEGENHKFYSSGFDDKAVEKLKSNMSSGSLPPCCAITNNVEIYDKPEISCNTCPLSKFYGNSKAVVVPVIYENNHYGHIGLSITTNVIKDYEELELIYEMANDIAFSIYNYNERKSYEEKLEKSYETIHKLTENMPGAIYQYKINPDGTSCFPFVSKGIASLYEVSVADVLKNSSLLFDCIHEDDSVMAETSIVKSMESMQEWNLEFRVVLPKKGLRWLFGKANPEKLDDGSIVWHGIVDDITQYKKNQEDVRLFKKSIEASTEGITITTAGEDVSTIYVNPAFEKLSGYSKEEILGKNLGLLNDKNKEQPEIELLQEAIKKQESVEVELKNCAKDGREFISRLTIDPIFDDNNKVTHFVGVQKDITKERRNLNQLILQAESINKSLAGINMIDDNGVFSYVNSSYLDMWGYADRNEVIGTSPVSHCYDSGIPEKIIKTLDSKGEMSLEFIAKRKDGSTFDVLMALKKITNHDGNNFYLGSSLDISEIKRNERKLRQSATVFENTTEGVMITDSNAVIIDVNEAFSEITGRTQSEAIGKKPSILKSGKHDRAFYKQMWSIITRKGSWKGEIWNRRKNDEIYPQWLNISSVKNDSGKTENYISVFSDITSLKETESKLDFLAHHDHLTELPNRTLLKARLEHSLSLDKRNKTLTAVMFIDIDNFKNINDSYGHSIGDSVLITVAKRINKIMREDDTLARIGGG